MYFVLHNTNPENHAIPATTIRADLCDNNVIICLLNYAFSFILRLGRLCRRKSITRESPENIFFQDFFFFFFF